MVHFVGVEAMIKLVEAAGVQPFLKGLCLAIEDDFRRWPAFEKTPRIASHSSVGVIELMPTSDGDHYGFKYVNGHPKNMKEGLQTVTAFGVLSDVSTGYPILVSEMTLLTALRTAATSAMAAKHLARADSQCMAIIGNGAQSEFQALAFAAICGIKRFRLYDIDPTASLKCAANLAKYGLDITLCPTAQDAVAGADIITTVTADKQCATILSDNMVGEGIHINAIGGDCLGKTELHKDILYRSNIFVEFTEQTRTEGEIQQLPENHPVTELWKVIDGTEPGRQSDKDITLFDSVGFAIEDFSALNFMRRQALSHGIFEELDLIADLPDPRNLFGVLEPGNQGVHASRQPQAAA
ncbi:MAG: ornithine cyclodeaminase [Hyphomicrobiales bacterium]|nr:ornithine cyclodeaminase [Hyphomicrobiales bacterium]MCP5002039.1 ornithine cyclodeaminase [Hyphomicrobiales bacterium]